LLTESKDKTIERERIKKYKFLVKEYELIKQKKHSKFKFVSDFYNRHNLKRQTFIKYYNRYLQTLSDYALIPNKRGPKWKSRRPIPFIEQKVIDLRIKGNNRFEIFNILKPILKDSTPSPSGIYHVFKRAKLNRMTPKMKRNKRQIIKEKAGELGHIDCHYLSKNLLMNDSKRYYLVCLLDDCTRIAWADVVEDIKSLTVMFSTLKCINMLHDQYNIKFANILSDNGPEFGGKAGMNNKLTNPFERLLIELGIKHSYTKPFRPQTNGKVERFWKTIKADLLEDSLFDNLDDLRKELLEFLIYYNHHRPHQGIDNSIPVEFNENCQRIT